MNLRLRLLWALLILLLVPACGPGDDVTEQPSGEDAIRVGAFDFAESELLAELYAQVLEQRGLPVARLGRIGPREIVGPALESGAVDLVAEYAGTAVAFFGDGTSPESSAAAVRALNEWLEPRGLVALTPSGAVDTNVFVMAAERASAAGIERLSDVAGAGLTRFGGPPECPDRPLCLVGLRETYGIAFPEFVTQPSLAFTAESLRRGEIDLGLLFSTSPELDAPDLVALEDDRGLQPPDTIVPLVRVDALDRWGSGVVEVLDALSAALTTSELRRLNRLVSEGEAPATVAAAWLARVGLAT